MAGYQNANGFITTYSYTAASQPRAVVNPLAQRITLTWTSLGSQRRAARSEATEWDDPSIRAGCCS
jgi:YD repeat-containing protein